MAVSESFFLRPFVSLLYCIVMLQSLSLVNCTLTQKPASGFSWAPWQPSHKYRVSQKTHLNSDNSELEAVRDKSKVSLKFPAFIWDQELKKLFDRQDFWNKNIIFLFNCFLRSRRLYYHNWALDLSFVKGTPQIVFFVKVKRCSLNSLTPTQ